VGLCICSAIVWKAEGVGFEEMENWHWRSKAKRLDREGRCGSINADVDMGETFCSENW
jgi:hypothetical protein